MGRIERGCGGVLLVLALVPTTVGAQLVELDVPYVLGGGHEQELDLFAPAVANYPTIVFVHEGGLTSGDRKDAPYAEMCATFQALGIGCVLANYRLAPQSRWPSQATDVASAFSWVKRHVAERGGDPGRVFLFGHSSGCLLVALVGTDRKYLESEGWAQRDVAGVVAMGCRLNDVVQVTESAPGQYETSWVPPGREADYLREEPAFESLADRNDAVPAAHVTSDLPPTLILIAEEERFFPPILRDAAEFVGRALAAGAEADLRVLAGRRHMSAIREMTTGSDPAIQLIQAFVHGH